jgi:2-polyprenyl-6-methoxyphenol hydroxylase-like FAD-dependent oxidoreductase
MKILIVGAGIGGLALAALLRQRGVSVSLVERASDFDHGGYMLSLYPIGNRVLHGLGLFEAFKKISVEFRHYEVSNGRGELLHRFDLTPIQERFGFTGQILRKDLLDLLRSAAPEVPVRMGTTVNGIEETQSEVRVRYSDGSAEYFDGLVAADGINSATRQLVFGSKPNEETGWGVWVWWADLPDQPKNTVNEFWGHERFVGVYPTLHKTGCVLGGPESLLGPEITAGDGRLIRRHFEALGGDAQKIVSQFPDSTRDLFFWRLVDQRAEKWTRGRIALLGDAACAFLPTAGVGASMALESAAVLADELSRTDAKFLPSAFSLYEKRRKHRAEAAQKDSRKLAAWLTTGSTPLAWTRDQFMKAATIDALLGSIAKSMSEPL